MKIQNVLIMTLISFFFISNSYSENSGILSGSKGMIGLVGLSAYCDFFDPDGIGGINLKAMIAKIILNINLRDIKLYSIAESDPFVSVSLGWRF